MKKQLITFALFLPLLLTGCHQEGVEPKRATTGDSSYQTICKEGDLGTPKREVNLLPPSFWGNDPQVGRIEVGGKAGDSYRTQLPNLSFTLEQPSSLLGMEPAVKWNLLANATDGSYIRNKIIRDLAYKSINAYEPQGEFAELYLNGVYQGLYLLTEAVEIGENRLEISPEDNWFIEMELDFRARDDETQMITDRGQTFIIHSDVKVSEEEKAQVLYRLNDIESALFAENGISSVSGKSLEQLIDLESFAEAWLVEELSGDHDAGITSQFLYASKEVDSLWYSGPVWDFDGIMTNVNTPMYAIPEALTTSIEMSRPEGDNNQNRWLAAMWKNPKFQLIVEEKYQSVFRENYRSILEYGVNEYVNQIQRSAVLDAFKWHKDRLSWFFTIPEGLHIPEEGAYDKYDTLEICTEVVKDSVFG